MKKLTFLLLFMLLPILTSAQNFDKYQDRKGVDEVVMTSKMFELLTEVDLNANDPEAQQYIDLIEGLKELRVLSSKDAGIRNEMAVDVANFLKNGSLEELMRVSEDGKSVKFYYKPGKKENYVSQLFMFMEGEKDNISVILNIIGEINLAQVSKLAKDFDLPAGEELKNIENQ